MFAAESLVKNIVLLVAYGAGLVAVTFVLSWATPLEPATVNVRWVPGLADSDRRALESTWRLTAAQDTDGTTYRYVLLDTSRANIRALVTHPSVEDTANIDRSAYRALNSPRVSRRQTAVLGGLGALLLVAIAPWIGMGTFWGIVGACTLTLVGLARALPAVGDPLLDVPHWLLVTVVGVAAVAVAARRRVTVSSRTLALFVGAPQLALVAAIAVTSALALVGVSPFWRHDRSSSLVEAAYEGDRAEVVRWLEQGANPRDTALVDGATRSALEAAVLSDDASMLRQILGAAGAIDDGTRAQLMELAERLGRADIRDALVKAR